MGLRRNIEFQNKENYAELQRLANLYSNGNCSEFVRLVAFGYEELKSSVIDLENEVRDLNREIRRLKGKLDGKPK